jgi:Putative peptidoglycan binding domain
MRRSNPLGHWRPEQPVSVKCSFRGAHLGEETQEAAAERPHTLFGRRGSAAGGLPPEQLARRRRVAAGIAAGIIVLVVIVIVLTGGSSSAAGAYRSYLGRLSPIAAGSQRLGRSLGQLLSRVRTGRVSDPLPRLDQLVGQARTELADAGQLKPPAGLRSEHQQALLALDFRARGLQGLHDSLGQARGSPTTAGLVTSVAAQINRLTTSDVVWHDRVWQPTVAALQQLRIAASLAPESKFLTDPNLATQQSIVALLQPQPAANTIATLTLGAHGPAVVAWQKQLNRWLRLTGRTPLTADGSFGPGTQAATQVLQRAAGLTPDGAVGPATRKALLAALAGHIASATSSG